MTRKAPRRKKSSLKQHPILKALLSAMVQDDSEHIHLPEDTYVALHAEIDKLGQAKELSRLAEALLNVAVNLDTQLNSEAASTHVGLLAKAAADRAISMNTSLTTSLDRISKNAAQYQKFSAQPQRLAARMPDEVETDEGVFKLSDLDPNRRKA
jgi:hypothetical protein